MMLSNDTTLAVTPHQVSSDLDGEAAILNLQTGVYYGLNAVGARIWTLLQQPLTVGEIQATVLAEYDVEPERCAADLRALLQDLLAHQLIEVQAAP